MWKLSLKTWEDDFYNLQMFNQFQSLFFSVWSHLKLRNQNDWLQERIQEQLERVQHAAVERGGRREGRRHPREGGHRDDRNWEGDNPLKQECSIFFLYISQNLKNNNSSSNFRQGTLDPFWDHWLRNSTVQNLHNMLGWKSLILILN